MTVTIVGTGLIGGSFALALKDKGLAQRTIGVDAQEEHNRKALSLGLVNETKDLAAAVAVSDLIILAIPVHAIIGMLPQVLDMVDQQVVIDVGSTKEGILEVV